MPHRRTPRLLAAVLSVAGSALAQSHPSVEQAARVVLEKNCFSCHGVARMSGLDLRTEESILAGGTRGPAVVPGNAEESLLYRRWCGKTSCGCRWVASRCRPKMLQS